MKREIYKLLVLFSVLLTLASCSGDENNDVDLGVSKLIIFNNTEYDVKKVYYKETKPSYEDLGIELTTEVLKHEGTIEFCPESKDYYITFVRQNGSTDNDLYISSENPLSFNGRDGIVTLQLLPYNFYYTSVINSAVGCSVK